MTCLLRHLAILLLGSTILCPATAGEPMRFLLSGNQLEIIVSGERKWNLLLEDIANARSEIEMEYYLFWHDAAGRCIRDALVQKAREGVTVRIIIENVMSTFERKCFFDEMEKAGIELRYFTDLERWSWQILPEINHRNHRKIAVIDGRIGYTGGMNLADTYYHVWRDTHLRVEGPSVADLNRVFLATWNRLGGERGKELPPPAPEDPAIEFVAGGPFYPVFLNRYRQILQTAHSYIYIQTPYLCPPAILTDALKAAAARGIDIRILVPKKADSPFFTAANQSFFRDVLEAGIRLFEYVPCFDHSKTLVCDDHTCWIGSVNFDSRSLLLNYEVSACLESEEIAKYNKAVFLDLLTDAREISLSEVKGWPVSKRFAHRLVRIFQKQL